jgi:hypothetical protein
MAGVFTAINKIKTFFTMIWLKLEMPIYAHG